MREPNQDGRPLSQAASELLDEWMLSRISDPGDDPGVDLLVRYQSGALSSDQIVGLEAAMVRKPSIRMLLRITRNELKQIRRMTWAEVSRLAESDTDSTGSEVARSVLALASASIGGSLSARETCRRIGWAALRDQANAGLEIARSAWAGLAALGYQLRLAVLAAPPAVARAGGADDQAVIVGDLPADLGVRLSAEVDRTGALTAVMRIVDASGDESSALDGMKVLLALKVNGGSWPLEPGAISAGRADWRMVEIGRALELAEGPLPSSTFRITIGDADAAADSSTYHLMVPIVETDGSLADRIPVTIEVADTPRFEGGVFHAVTTVDGAIRRAYPDYRLRLEVSVGGTARQCLGYWPLADWIDARRELTAPCPGSPDAAADITTLHATILPGETMGKP